MKRTNKKLYQRHWEIPAGWWIFLIIVIGLAFTFTHSSLLRSSVYGYLKPVARPFVMLALTEQLEGHAGAQQISVSGLDVWTLTKYELHYYPRSDPGSAQLKLIPKTVEVGSFSSFGIADNAHVWIGTWQGELVSLKDQKARIRVDRESSIGKVQAILPAGGQIYLATSRGLWIWNEQSEVLSKVSYFDERAIKGLMQTPDGTILVAESRTVTQQTSSGWVQWPDMPEFNGTIRAVESLSDGTFLINTDSGIVWFDEDALSSSNALSGKKVDSADRSPSGELWAGSWDQGIWWQAGDRWTRLSHWYWLPDSINSIRFDSQGNLWISVYDQGVIYFKASQFLELEGIHGQ